MHPKVQKVKGTRGWWLISRTNRAIVQVFIRFSSALQVVCAVIFHVRFIAIDHKKDLRLCHGGRTAIGQSRLTLSCERTLPHDQRT
jgi:hypothetical protein